MVNSMTGFSRLQSDTGNMTFCWEVKSVNHRYLDVAFRLPESFRFLEMTLRSLVRGKIQRGKLECQLKIMGMDYDHQAIDLEKSLVSKLLATGKQLADTYQITNDITVSQLLNWPGVVKGQSMNGEAIEHSLTTSFAEAIQQLSKVRSTEGSAIKVFMLEKLKCLSEQVGYASNQVEQSALNVRDKLLARIEQLSLQAEEGRVEQEIAMILSRLDVSEELDRLNVHINEVENVLTGGNAIGKRLDFLMQELNREANTLSSKSNTSALTQIAVEMKVLIEQMREQVQNIE